MDDKLRESISALMDDEANELEARRVLSKACNNELADTWKRYHKVRDLMSGMSELAGSSTLADKLHQPIDVSANVAAAIRGQALPDQRDSARSSKASNSATKLENVQETLSDVSAQGKTSTSSWIKFGSAIAACLVVAIGVSMNAHNAASTQGITEIVQVSDEPPVVNQLEAGQVHSFNEYLLRHSELSTLKVSSGMAPLIRVASVNSVGI